MIKGAVDGTYRALKKVTHLFKTCHEKIYRCIKIMKKVTNSLFQIDLKLQRTGPVTSEPSVWPSDFEVSIIF